MLPSLPTTSQRDMESNIVLRPHQEKALAKLKSGAILFGGVGTGKSFTGLMYYQKNHSDKELYILTTAKKRDSKEWSEDCTALGITASAIDSWNNIKKYKDVTNAFFIFDEQKVVGYGAWSKTFIRISRSSKWILLSATPGDTWMDYIPTFIANGFYEHKTDFLEQHVEFDRFVKYPKVKRYHNEGKLLAHRNHILVPMPMERHTKRIPKYVETDYVVEEYMRVAKDRWNIFTEEPIKNASELTQTLRRIPATDNTRINMSKWIMGVHDKIIVYYNYNYERDILLRTCEQLGKPYSQWNGHAHEEIPDTDRWIYLVQYTSGSEGWNCVETDVMLFYSLNYSYRIMEQAEGRIDRLNTPFTDLTYYYLTSQSVIDQDVQKAVAKKEKFNESAWFRKRGLSF